MKLQDMVVRMSKRVSRVGLRSDESARDMFVGCDGNK